ncbi:MAG: peptidylprolyl isomerase [Lachnospiraceae bacterium]|nr:peptidylprolyl isomerase [Lachnospiraceae bacterium]
MPLSGCGKTENEATQIVLTTEFTDNEIFRIDNLNCTVPEANIYMYTAEDQYTNVFGKEIWNADIKNSMLLDELKDVTLARLAQIKAMALLAGSRSIELDEEEKQKVHEAAQKYMAGLDPASIAKLSISEEIVENMYGDYALAEKVYDSITANVNPEISDDEARTIKVKHILIKTYEADEEGNKTSFGTDRKNVAFQKAVAIRKEAVSEGADFDALIDKYSEDTTAEYVFGKGTMPEKFEEAAFELGTDEISDVVQTDYGFHIIKCISTFDRDETDANKQRILKQRKKEAFNATYEEFIKTLHSNLNSKLWDSLDFSIDDEINTTNFFDVYNEVFNVVG